MGAEMRRLRLTKLLIVVAAFAALPIILADPVNEHLSQEGVGGIRKQRDIDGELFQDPRSVSAVIEAYDTFGKRTPQFDEYSTDEDDITPKKRVRIRVPVIRSRNAREHAVTVVRRRPLVPYTRSSSFQPLETTSSFAPRRVVTRTRIRNYDSSDVPNNLGDDILNDLFTKTNRHKVTVTRRRKIQPTTTLSTSYRERITRKKLVNVRPVPEPTSTLAIITTGFYTIPSVEDDEEYFDVDSSTKPTPNLYSSSPATETLATEELDSETSFVTPNKPTLSSEPVIITDNFFLPELYEETTTNDNKEVTKDFRDKTTSDNVQQKDVTESTISEDVETTEKESQDVETNTTAKYDEETTTLLDDEDITEKSLINDTEISSKIPEIDETSKLTTSDIENVTTEKIIETTLEDVEDNLKVIPIKTHPETVTESLSKMEDASVSTRDSNENSEIPTVIPLEPTLSTNKEISETQVKTASTLQVTTSLPSLTPEDIEGGLSDDLYLSLSRPDFPQIAPSKVEQDGHDSSSTDSNVPTPELETSIYYSETVVTSTRLRTYTYVVTKLNGLETEVTSSTTVRPRVTTLTLTVPVTVTVTPTKVLPSVALTSSSLGHTKHNADGEEEGRRFNLETRVMSNGVEVIVAGTTPAYRWENSNPQPTLTLSEAVVMLLPQDKPNEFVTKTCTTTLTYLNTITRDGTTIVSTDEQVIANTATEERHRKPVSEAASVTLEASPTLKTEVFKTTYTYLTLNTDHPDENNALGSSTRVIANTVTAPQSYLDMILEPSEAQRPETNTYISTRVLEKSYVEGGKTKIEMTNDVVTQLIITESAPPTRSTTVTSTLPALDESISPTEIPKTYYVTYTYYNTYLKNDSTVVESNVATSSDIVYEKVPAKKTATMSVSVNTVPEPIQIFATKTYLTTFTYFTTLLQGGADGATLTTISSHTQIVENVVTESIAPSLLDAGYMNALLTTSHHSDTLKNVVTGSTIIFFDDEEPVAPTSTTAFEASVTTSINKVDNFESTSAAPIPDSIGSESNDVTSRPIEQDNYNDEEIVEESTDSPPSKKPSQVSNLLSLGSLGINSLSALGPVITAMAGLLQGKTSATRRNDTEPATESPITTTQRSPIYIPVGEFADGDIETAESQNIALHLANSNHLPETRHKVTSSLADGIPISPGEIITANSDVIIGKPGKLGPRPPQTFLKDENIGMKPPPVPVPNIPVHPVLEVVENEPPKAPIKIQKGSQQLEILPAHQIYEEHIKVPVVLNQPSVSKRPQILHQTFLNAPPKRISSKQDILENDPLLIPPSLSNTNVDVKNRNPGKNRRPWSPKDPLSNSNFLIEDKNRLNYQQQEIIQADNINTKPHVPEPIVHQVPHVIDRSTGQPLLVNIQPSQVANVVIPQGGTQALIFGDTSEPHISGQYFDDPSPYPEPEVGPGFVGIDKVENLPQFSKNDNPSDYMTPPSPPVNLKPLQNSAVDSRPHVIPLSQNQDFKQHINGASRPEKIPIRHHDNSNLSNGHGHVHTEILVHHGGESGQIRPQPRPSIPTRNYQNLPYPPRREHTKIHIPAESTPPRRTEVPLSTENSFYDSVNNSPANRDKKPSRNPPSRWSRPTSRPRLPTRITGRPYGKPTRIERPVGPIRQPPFLHTQRLPNVYYPNDFNKPNQQTSTAPPFIDTNQKIYTSGVSDQFDLQNKAPHYYQEHYGIFEEKRNQTMKDSEDYITGEHHLSVDSEYKDNVDENESNSSTHYGEKTVDSDVDASENVKITSGGHENDSDEDFVTDSEDESPVTFNHNSFINNISTISDSSVLVGKPIHNNNYQTKINGNEEGDIIVGSEKKQDHYASHHSGIDINNANRDSYTTTVESESDENITHLHEIVDLKPPAIIPTFEPNGHSRPFSKPNFAIPSIESKPEIITKAPAQKPNIYQGHMRPGAGQVFHVESEKKDRDSHLDIHRNESHLHIYRGRPRPNYATQIHPDHPQIITKPKPQVPGPVLVSSGNVEKQKQNNYKQPSVQFSLPIDSTGEENDSKTQTERPLSANFGGNNQKLKKESLNTAYQTSFANKDSNDEHDNTKDTSINMSSIEIQKITTPKTKPLAQDMIPPPVTSSDKDKVIGTNPVIDEGLKPPPSPTDVLGLSPPPVDITTTSRPLENKQNHPKITSDVSGLQPPPLYIPLKESTVTPPLPSISMVPPSPRPSVVRPYLVDILSQDMIPPPPEVKTTRPLEIATVRPGVAVSGSIQIATAVATSHIPVIQDVESKIPIVHGTVDLPVVVDVPDFLKPIDARKPDHVSVYTIRPFETRHRSTIKPTIASTYPSSSTVVRHPQIKNDQHKPHHHQILPSTRVSQSPVLRRPSKVSEFSIVLEPSTDIHLPSTRIEPTESLSTNSIHKIKTVQRPTKIDIITKAPNVEVSQISKNVGKGSTNHRSINKTDQKIKESASKMMEIIGTVVHEFIQNSTNERVEIKPQVVTHYETLTVTRTETSVLGSPPTTITSLITRTLTSTRVETVTETLLRPTSVISTITSTVLHSVTHVPSYDNGNDNDSIFVIMSDQKPPSPGAEEVEAEYGEEDVSRDEQDVSGNEIHRVLSGGILGAPSVPIRSPKIQCVPECKTSKFEICAETGAGEMRCVCRPGFARMFPDRPCKPTYTFTVGVVLDRIGRDRFVYESGMNDTNSVVFRRYARPIKEALDRTLMQSDLRDVYRDINIAKFASDPARVLFNVQLSSNTDETRLKDVIRKYLVMSNYSLGGTDVYASKDLGMVEASDFDECANEHGGPHHDCSPHAACFNLKGSYQCSCKEGWADLSENSAYPGRTCSQAPLGCSACNNKGHCVVNIHGQEVCECFPWHSGQKCQINLKVLLIALVTTGAILLGLLAVCVGMACFRNPDRRRRSADRRAMISGTGGDTSSEGSVTELAIPHHVPHILPPPPQMVAPAPPIKNPVKKISGKPRRAPRKPAPIIAPVPTNASCAANEQRDRSLTVMIPRVKYRSAPYSATSQNYKPMSTFAVDEHRLIDYLDGGAHPGNRKPSLISNNDYKESDHRIPKQHTNFTPTGALVSAGFQVSATVTRTLDAESTLARSCGETTVEPSTKVLRGADYPQDMESTLVRSCAETTIQASTKQLLRLDLAEAGSTLARSCGETTIQPPTKMAERKDCNRDARDSASEGHTMAERDLGSTLRLPAQHAPLYNQDRSSSDRESNFDSL